MQELLTTPYIACWRPRSSRPSSPPPHDPRKKESVGLLAVGPLLDTLISALQTEPVYEVRVSPLPPP